MVWYGADYSARELSPGEITGFKDYPLTFLMRYIGYPGNPKCISHYPGAFNSHEATGRTVLLVHEHDINDPAGGFSAGVSHAQTALADARSIGYPENRPIWFCADRNPSGVSDATAGAYLDGAASVLGHDRVGAYGFRDFVRAAINGNHARWIWLCGASPVDDAEVANLRINIYQFNNGRIYPGGLECDLNWSYQDPKTITSGGAPDMDATQDAMLKAIYNQLTGSFVNGEYPGWATLDGSNRKMTIVDMMRETHGEAHKFLPSRVPGSTAKDTVLGYAANADALGNKAVALLAGLQAAVDKLSVAVAAGTSITPQELQNAVATAIQQNIVHVNVDVKNALPTTPGTTP